MSGPHKKKVALAVAAVVALAVVLGAAYLASPPEPADTRAFVAARGTDERVVVVRATREGAAASAAQALVQRLRHELPVDAWSARGGERGFFAMRWPLWVDADELRELERALVSALASGTPPDVAAWFERAGRTHLRDAERLARFSSEFPGTPDGDAVLVTVHTRGGPSNDEALARVLRAEQGRHADVSMDLVDPLFGDTSSVRARQNIALANGALWGGSFPVVLVAETPEKASAIAGRLRASHGGVFADVRTLADEVPPHQDERAEVALRIRQLMREPGTASFPADVRDVLRDRPIFPGLRAFSAIDLPAFVTAAFAPRAPGRVVVAIPRESLRPDRSDDVAAVRRALADVANEAAPGGVFLNATPRTLRAGRVALALKPLRLRVDLRDVPLGDEASRVDDAELLPHVHAAELTPALGDGLAVRVEGDFEGETATGLFGASRVRIELSPSEAFRARSPLVSARVPEVVSVVCSTRGCGRATN